MDIILSTTNSSKAEQIKAVFTGTPVNVLTLKEAGISGEAVEDGETLEDNALKKAMYAHERAEPGVWTMADDTGLFIHALGGEPGVRSARWAGESASTEEIISFTLEKLSAQNDRSATFKTVVALVSPLGEKYFFKGEANGRLLEQPRRKPQPNMHYSGLFVPEGSSSTWAEMSVEEENKISHRGKAFAKVKEFITTLL